MSKNNALIANSSPSSPRDSHLTQKNDRGSHPRAFSGKMHNRCTTFRGDEVKDKNASHPSGSAVLPANGPNSAAEPAPRTPPASPGDSTLRLRPTHRHSPQRRLLRPLQPGLHSSPRPLSAVDDGPPRGSPGPRLRRGRLYLQ